MCLKISVPDGFLLKSKMERADAIAYITPTKASFKTTFSFFEADIIRPKSIAEATPNI
jgi:CRISPR/Cas system CMR-associated protein Cmr5 small subunit